MRGRVLDGALNVYAALALLYLLVPIAIIIVFSFNDPRGRFNFIWQEFSLDAWSDPFSVPGLGDALAKSLEIAAISTVVATALGTLTALALVRYEFRGRAPVNFFIFIPLATPEVVLGAALLSLFLNFAVATGFGTIVIAHIMFNLSFVIVTVRSRLIGFDRSLEEAAQDLGATPVATFFLVTLPLITPGIFAGSRRLGAVMLPSHHGDRHAARQGRRHRDRACTVSAGKAGRHARHHTARREPRRERRQPTCRFRAAGRQPA
jgi:spermidine/putrescine transport system permease protein